MVSYSAGGSIEMETPWPAGSVESRLGVNRQTGTAAIAPWRDIPADLLPYVDEYNASLNLSQRQEARKKRSAAERAAGQAALQDAIEQALASGTVPDGFAVVDHRDRNTAISVGASFGAGFLMIRSTDLEAVASVGFRVAPWPAHVADPEQKPIGNSLPAVPLAIVRHPDQSVMTDRGHDLGRGYRLIVITDLKYLNSLGWQPAVWPAP
jgi:hypothetical protein